MKIRDISLRNYQIEMQTRIQEAWSVHNSVMVQMPTGTGKTYLLASVVRDFFLSGQTGPVWIIAHRRELVSQIEETLERYGVICNEFFTSASSENLSGKDSEIRGAALSSSAILSGKNSEIYGAVLSSSNLSNEDSSSERITFSSSEGSLPEDGSIRGNSFVRAMSIQWLSRHWDEAGSAPGLIVIDEAHHSLAVSYSELWQRYPASKKLGMTATPCRMNGAGFTCLFEKLITSHSIAEFVEQGVLSVFDYISIRPDSDEQRLIGSLVKRGADGDYQVKEMNDLLNRRSRISRLYRSLQRFAPGKKGIVYAISIDHARQIAAYYRDRGLRAVSIDSKTPSLERKRLVSSFKSGEVDVLINVDVFSEGFDCPDVEFIQLARPTLSLAKYLQQVGRGLRRSAGKETCVLIDNVGLYHIFGLPTEFRDWEAMFKGRLSGRRWLPDRVAFPFGGRSAEKGDFSIPSTLPDGVSDVFSSPADDLFVVITHDRLLSVIQEQQRLLNDPSRKFFGRLGEVLGIRGQFAVIRFCREHVGVVDEKGDVIVERKNCRKVKFLEDDLLHLYCGKEGSIYVDLRNGKCHNDRPQVLKYGGVEILRTAHGYYSRTRKVYWSRPGFSPLFWMGFYLKIYDTDVPRFCRYVDEGDGGFAMPSVCLLEQDNECAYYLSGILADGSIVVMDAWGRYYHVEKGRGKRYVACNRPLGEDEDFDVVIPRLCREARRRVKVEAGKREAEVSGPGKHEKEGEGGKAVPYQAGSKWGLKIDGGHILVAPIYRRIEPLVHGYFMYEDAPCQWGVLAADGRVMIRAQYMKVELEGDDRVRLTLVPGKSEVVKLPG